MKGYEITRRDFKSLSDKHWVTQRRNAMHPSSPTAARAPAASFEPILCEMPLVFSYRGVERGRMKGGGGDDDNC